MSEKNIEYTRGSDNVFADLGIENPEDYQLKAQLARLINNAIKNRGWTQKQTAEVLGVKQPHISELHRGLLDRFSLNKLIQFLRKLDHHITMTVSSDKDALPPLEILVAAQMQKTENRTGL